LNLPIVFVDGLFLRENFGDRFQVVLARSTSLRQDRKDAKQHAVFPNGHEVVLILWGGALSMETLPPSDAPSYLSYVPLQLRGREMDKQQFFFEVNATATNITAKKLKNATRFCSALSPPRHMMLAVALTG
jgi:hypothetical protein